MALQRGGVESNKASHGAFYYWGYMDVVVCDVVPSHLLLGRPWQFDHEVVHNGRTNTYTISKDRKHILLTPLIPSQAMRD